MSKTKVCTKCKNELLLGLFGKDKKAKDGLAYSCKECYRQYYRNVRKQKLEYARKYRAENKEKIALWKKEHYENNKEEINRYKKEWYQKNKEHVLQRMKEYRTENHEEIKRRKRIYNFKNPGNGNIRAQRYRTRKRSLPSTFTQEQWNEALEFFNNSCAYCGTTEDVNLQLYNESLHQDHFVPLSKGGEYTHNNIVPSCKRCNVSKSNKDFFKWYPQQDFSSQKRKEKILNFLGYNKNKNRQLSIL